MYEHCLTRAKRRRTCMEARSLKPEGSISSVCGPGRGWGWRHAGRLHAEREQGGKAALLTLYSPGAAVSRGHSGAPPPPPPPVPPPLPRAPGAAAQGSRRPGRARRGRAGRADALRFSTVTAWPKEEAARRCPRPRPRRCRRRPSRTRLARHMAIWPGPARRAGAAIRHANVRHWPHARGKACCVVYYSWAG